MVKSGNRSTFSSLNDPNPVISTNELKYKDSAFTVTGSVAGSILTISNPSQGVNANQRLGDRARLLKCEILGTHYSIASANDQLRMIILQAKGLTPAPTVTDILTVAAPYAPYVYNAREVYDIIDDQLLTVAVGGDTAIHNIKQGFIPKIKDMKFVSGGNTLYNGQMYILLVYFNPAATATAMNFRMWFEDSN